ncbi:uncharacterized protein LOC125658340 isoform X2 [Ostrea edulis]|uniref:uncharacterized protein LOC125658340 isoform X2 n=1 Tax=Ostrea edulis TaxID=37623 RepID=UPI002094DE78|nr:uncharacterized protein LOC125658340 isoform X2 [Ostrea edulis]
MRKSIVTGVRKSHPWARDPLAAHMSHQLSTADKYYNMQNRQDMVIPFSEVITNTMTEGNPSDLPEETPETKTAPRDTLAIEDVPPSTSQTASSLEEDLDDVQMEHGRRTSTEREVRSIVRLCSGLTKNGGITQSSVTHFLGDAAEGVALMLQVQSRIGSFFQKKLTKRVQCES